MNKFEGFLSEETNSGNRQEIRKIHQKTLSSGLTLITITSSKGKSTREIPVSIVEQFQSMLLKVQNSNNDPQNRVLGDPPSTKGTND